LIRVKIVAPAIAVRAGLRALLSDDPTIQVIAEATDLTKIKETQTEADVVVWSPTSSLDQDTVPSELSNMRIDETAALLMIYNDPKVIETLTRQAVRAWGVLSPEATQAELIASIQALNEGLAVTNPVWLNQVFMSQSIRKEADNDLVEPLTGREIEILQLLALGLTNKQIAARLRISAHTVKFHVSTIFSKMGTTNRVETVNLGLKKGLILL
jgi:two-component system, NarL family, response regulator YdfI